MLWSVISCVSHASKQSALKEYDMVGQKDFVQLTYEGLRNDYIFNGGYDWQTASMACIETAPLPFCK